MNCKLFIASLVAGCFLFLSAGKACALDKESFNVLNVPKVLDKDIFNISTNVIDVKDVKEKCKDCDCGCKETGKCKCGEKCPCDCGCGKSGKCECKKPVVNPFEVKKNKPVSWAELYGHVAKGGKGVLFVGVKPSGDDLLEVYVHKDTLGDFLANGVYDVVRENGQNVFKLRVKTEVRSSCPGGNCPNQTFQYFPQSSCPNGKCPNQR